MRNRQRFSAAVAAAAFLSTAWAAAVAAPAPTPVEVQLAAAHLPEPLVATGPTTPAEDMALLRGVEAWQARRNPDDFSSLGGFLKTHPRSAWRVAVLTNLGIVYRHYAYFSRALDAWRSAWEEGRVATGPRVHALVDRAVGELVQLEAELGQKQELAATLAEIGKRPVTGPGTALVQNARETLWVMNTDPKHLYNCGPLALKTLMLAQHASLKQVFFLNWVRADGPQGTNMAEVAALARKAHFDLVAVFRKPGEAVPVPSVVHWQVGHFSTIVGAANGRYHIEDPTFGHQGLWVTQAALDAGASGYFLVPAIEARAGDWRKVTVNEAGRVWGAGQTENPPPDDPGPPADPPPGCGGMCGYGISELAVGVTLADHPVGYTPPKGPSAKVTISYNQWEAGQPANFNYFNVGQKWALNWLTYIQDDPSAPGTNVSRYLPDGSQQAYSGYDGSTHQFAPEEDDASILKLEKTGPIVYERFLKDGSVETYAESDGSAVFPRNVFLTKIIDPQGNALTLNYGRVGGQVRLVSLTDATGRRTSFGYGSRTSPLLVTRITDPFGRSASMAYDGDGRLSSITDVLGLTSKFTYDASSVIVALTTPYGTTRFAYGAAQVGGSDKRFVNAIDPLGYGEREETFQPASFLASSERQVPSLPPGIYPPYFNAYLQYRDSFHWNKHQYAVAGCTANGGCNYADARLTHFVHDGNDINIEWYTIESQKQPLENRVWYTYPGQPLTGGLGAGQSGTYDQTNSVARVLDNGETQLTQFAYNEFGNPTGFIDPAGRTTTLTYATNRIDVASIAQAAAGGSPTIASFTYDSHHRPLSYTDAAGRTTRYTYDSAGQLTSVTNPLGQRTSYDYDGTGDLFRIVNADGKTAASFTYDGLDRVASYTDAGGWTVKYAYDAADRLTRATYPDGTSDTYTYNKLDLASYTDRQGQVWVYGHDADRRLVSSTDPLGHVTKYAYYEDGTLKSLTDPDGHTTTWEVDVESRPTAKIYADGTLTTYQYENTTSRLASETDALGQIKSYQYALDNRLAGIVYQNALHPTPDVAYDWDPHFPRLAAMTDGTGTTSYSYVPVGKLGALRIAQENTPLPNGKIVYSYDALGRLAALMVGGAPSETFAYDRIGRLVDHTDALGEFATSYLGETGQPVERRLVGGSVATAWSYLSNSGDRRLAEIDNKYPNERQFHYTTTPLDLITKIVEDKSKGLLQSWSLGYDRDNRLTSAIATVAGRYAYGLDPAGNITSFLNPAGTTTAAYNKVNELADLGGRPLLYDADGELVSDGVRSFVWDAENRLIGISHTGLRASFAYDGLDRRVAITATQSGKTTTTRYLWCGTRLCEARSGASAVARLYYPEGEVIPAARQADDTLFYYGPDQLGSVRDVYAKSPVFSMVQQYDYDPYGNPIKVPATGPFPDFRFAGMLYPDNGTTDAGLYLTQYRAYDAGIGRWLSRDPIGEFPARIEAPKELATELMPPAVMPEHLPSARDLLSALQYGGADAYVGITQTATAMPLSDFRKAGSPQPAASPVFLAGDRAQDPRAAEWPSSGPIEEAGSQNLYAYVDGLPTTVVDRTGLDGTSCPAKPPKPWYCNFIPILCMYPFVPLGTYD